MQKIALITDSACDLDLNTLKENNINLLPLRIIYSNAEYRDRIDISPSEVYKNLENEIPKTSLPSAKDTEEILNKLEEESYTHVICISISSGLSGSYNALRLALEDHPNLTSFVYDTKILAYPQGEIVLEVAKLIREGKSFNEIVSEIPNIRKRITGYFTLNTLEYLKKGGRIGRLAGTVGELLNLKPIITTDENGVYYTVTKVRGRKQSLSKMTELLNAGFIDSFRYLYPEKENAYTWWSYMMKAREKNVGWRIDYFITSNSLKEKIEDSKIHSEVMGSDHCPIELDIEV